MHRAHNADTHALKQHLLSQNSSPVCSSCVPVIVSDMCIEPEGKKRAENVVCHTAKIVQKEVKLFRYY